MVAPTSAFSSAFSPAGTEFPAALDQRLKDDEEEGSEEDGDDAVSSTSSDADNSRHDALCEMLGIASLDLIAIEDSDATQGGGGASWSRFHSCGPEAHRDWFRQEGISRAAGADFRAEYYRNGYTVFDASLSIPASFLRQATERLVWGNKKENEEYYDPNFLLSASGGGGGVQRTYERIGNRRCLTRLEQFCDDGPAADDHREERGGGRGCGGEWNLVADYVGACLSEALVMPMVLFKEKLNLKPPGGSGFAPHLDAPSLLQLDGGESRCGPTDFVTVMVAIDDMTSQNGCLRISPGPWTRENAVATVLASGACGGSGTADRDNPDGGGRRGLIPPDVADALDFVDVEVKGGTMVAFSGYTPHRSSVNASHFARRAVFLTYNPAEQGDYRQAYYDRMKQLRYEYRIKRGFLPRDDDDDDARAEREALRSIPRI
jgi:hypothetical protein